MEFSEVTCLPRAALKQRDANQPNGWRGHIYVFRKLRPELSKHVPASQD